MEDNTESERDAELIELIYAWDCVPWHWRRALSLAMAINAQMDKLASMRKTNVIYVIVTALVVSCTGSMIFVIRGDALMSLAFGGLLAATLIFAAFYLVWLFFR